MDSSFLAFALWILLVVVLMSVVGYLIGKIKPDKTNPDGSDMGNAFWYTKLGRKK